MQIIIDLDKQVVLEIMSDQQFVKRTELVTHFIHGDAQLANVYLPDTILQKYLEETVY